MCYKVTCEFPFPELLLLYPECNLLKILSSVNKTLDQWNLIESKRLYIKTKCGVKWKKKRFDNKNEMKYQIHNIV